jgi:hypothetical protein
MVIMEPRTDACYTVAGGSNRPVKAHDVPFANSTSCIFRVKYGFTLAGILRRFPKLAALIDDMQLSSVSGVDPPVTYDRIETITREIYAMYGLPASSVMPFIR